MKCDHCSDYAVLREVEIFNYKTHTYTDKELWCKQCIKEDALVCPKCGRVTDGPIYKQDGDQYHGLCGSCWVNILLVEQEKRERTEYMAVSL